VFPGAPQSIVVALEYARYSFTHAGIVVYDNGTARPTSTFNLHYVGRSISFGATPSRLYGFDAFGSPIRMSRYVISAAGITLQDTVSDGILVGGSGSNPGQITFSGGRLYNTNGRVIDPEALTTVGLIAVGFVIPDPALNRVFVLDDQNLGPASLGVFDQTSLTLVGGKNYTGTTLLKGFVRWGPKGIAWITKNGKIALVTAAPGA
jgi:hypothetical protein